MKNIEKYKKITMIATFVALIVIFNKEVYAAGVGINSIPIVQNLKGLAEDITKWLTIMLPIVAIAVVIFCQIRKTMADEHEKAQWDKRTIGTIISLAIGMSATFIIKLIVSMTGSGTV